jgi:acyl-coenzyme A synthetase/AMP-(fatty) acid ligase
VKSSAGRSLSVTRSSNWQIHLPAGVDPAELDLLAAGDRVLVSAATSMELVIAYLGALRTERLAGFKRPRILRYVEALPRNALGKVQKYELRP